MQVVQNEPTLFKLMQKGAKSLGRPLMLSLSPSLSGIERSGHCSLENEEFFGGKRAEVSPKGFSCHIHSMCLVILDNMPGLNGEQQERLAGQGRRGCGGAPSGCRLLSPGVAPLHDAVAVAQLHQRTKRAIRKKNQEQRPLPFQ